MRRAVSSGVEVFITADKNIRHQQNISKYEMAVIIFDVHRNTLSDLRMKLPQLYELLPKVQMGKLYIC